jgi:hypothetical protein
MEASVFFIIKLHAVKKVIALVGWRAKHNALHTDRRTHHKHIPLASCFLEPQAQGFF